MARVLVTGANGFIGQALIKALPQYGHVVLAGSRTEFVNNHKGQVVTMLPGASSRLTEQLKDVDCIIHLAGRAHVLNESEANPLQAFRESNRNLTIDLAQCAIEAGVKRFIFISSIGVNGVETLDVPFNELSACSPQANYAVSKLEAEILLKDLVASCSMELTIIRPPMVYGANAPGNFRSLMKVVSSGLPLPLKSVKNTRSLIFIDNLIDVISVCVKCPSAAGQTFLVSDCDDVSTSQLVSYLAAGMGRKSRDFWVPPKLALLAFSCVNRKMMFTQLYGSLVIDSSKVRSALSWMPPFKAREALYRTGREFSLINGI